MHINSAICRAPRQATPRLRYNWILARRLLRRLLTFVVSVQSNRFTVETSVNEFSGGESERK
jgi:hypothetical protein